MLELFCLRILCQLQQRHQEDEAVLVVLSLDVSQVELRQVPEGLDGEYPEVVEDPCHLGCLGIDCVVT